MRGGGVGGDDVDSLADTEDVAGIGGMPEGGGVADVGLGGDEELQGDVCG